MLHKKCPYSEFFWSAFSPHFPAFGPNTVRYSVFSLNTERYSVFSPNAGKCGKNADQRNSEYGHFLRSETRVSFLFFEILDKENIFELEWFKQNGKILNLHKYQTIIIDKRRSNLRNIHLN